MIIVLFWSKKKINEETAETTRLKRGHLLTTSFPE